MSMLDPSSCGFKKIALNGLNLSKQEELNLVWWLFTEGNFDTSNQIGVLILLWFKICFVSFLFQVFLQHCEFDPEYKIFKSSKFFCIWPPSPSKPWRAIKIKS